MAWITPKKTGGFLVRWRDENRKTKSKFFQGEAEAIAYKAERDGIEKAAKVLSTMPGIPGWDDDTLIPADETAAGSRSRRTSGASSIGTRRSTSQAVSRTCIPSGTTSRGPRSARPTSGWSPSSNSAATGRPRRRTRRDAEHQAAALEGVQRGREGRRHRIVPAPARRPPGAGEGTTGRGDPAHGLRT